MPSNPYRYHAMITMNHAVDHIDDLFCNTSFEGEVYQHPLPTQHVFKDITFNNLERCFNGYVSCVDSVRAILDKAIKPGPFEYGVAVFEKGTEEDSSNWHIHIAIKTKWNYVRTPDTVHKVMKKQFPDKPQHIDITYKHHATGTTWKWNDMVDYLIKQSQKKPDAPFLCAHPIFFGTKTVDGEDQVCCRENIYDTDELAITFDQVKAFKQESKPFHQVLEHLQIVDDSLQYRKLIDYYKALPPPKVKLLETEIQLYKWQANVDKWVNQPMQEGHNGLWLQLESGAGKTMFLKYLIEKHQCFIPGLRPNGNYDCLSLMGYNDEPLMLFNEMQPSKVETYQGTKHIWKRGFIQLLKQSCDVFPIAFQFGGERQLIVPKCKVIITSNYDPPEDPGFQRRFTIYKSKEDTYATQLVETQKQLVVTTTKDVIKSPLAKKAKLDTNHDDIYLDIEPDNI